MSSENNLLYTIPGIKQIVQNSGLTVLELLKVYDAENYEKLNPEVAETGNITGKYRFDMESEYLHVPSVIQFFYWVFFVLLLVSAILKFAVLKVSVCEPNLEHPEIKLITALEDQTQVDQQQQQEKKDKEKEENNDDEEDDNDKKNNDDDEDEDEDDVEKQKNKKKEDIDANNSKDKFKSEDKKEENDENVIKKSTNNSKNEAGEDGEQIDNIDLGMDKKDNEKNNNKSVNQDEDKTQQNKDDLDGKDKKKSSTTKQQQPQQQQQQQGENDAENQKDGAVKASTTNEKNNENKDKKEEEKDIQDKQKPLRIIVGVAEDILEKYIVIMVIIIYLTINFGSYTYTAFVFFVTLLLYVPINSLKILDNKEQLQGFQHLGFHIWVFTLYCAYFIVNQQFYTLASSDSEKYGSLWVSSN